MVTIKSVRHSFFDAQIKSAVSPYYSKNQNKVIFVIKISLESENIQRKRVTMFYLKYNGEKLPIEDGNVYTICPECGREHAVDLQEILEGGSADLYGTAVYCEECSARRDAAHSGQDKQAQEIAQRFGVDVGTVQNIVRSGLDVGLPVNACYVGARLALSLANGEEELFDLQDVAAVMGCTVEEARQALHDKGIDPATVTVSPVFKAALAAWRDEHPAGEE